MNLNEWLDERLWLYYLNDKELREAPIGLHHHILISLTTGYIGEIRTNKERLI